MLIKNYITLICIYYCSQQITKAFVLVILRDLIIVSTGVLDIFSNCRGVSRIFREKSVKPKMAKGKNVSQLRVFEQETTLP